MGVPETAKPLAHIMEDPDAEEPNPFVHWMLYNLPATVTSSLLSMDAPSRPTCDLIPVAPCVDAAPRARLQV